MAYSKDQTLLVSGAFDHKIKIWNLKLGTCEATLRGHTDCVTCISISSNDEYVVSGSCDLNLILWSLKNGEHINTFSGHSSEVTNKESYEYFFFFFVLVKRWILFLVF